MMGPQPQQVQGSPQQGQTLSKGFDSDFTRWIENIEDVINQFEHDLRGEVYKEDSGEWVPIPGTQIMNEQGINATTKFIRSYANRNTFFSDVDEQRVRDIGLSASFEFTDMLTFNLHQFGVNLNYYSLIIEEVNNFLEMALRRAVKGGEREWLSKTESVHRIIQQDQNQKTGMLGGLMK